MRVRTRPLVASLFAGAALGFAGEPTPAPVAFGTAHPGLVEAVDPAGRWIVVCQAREDTDHDGKVETFVGYHGNPYGDDLMPFLVVGGGPGTPLDRVIAVDPASRYVVGTPKGRVTLFDTRTGTVTDLTPKPAQEGESTHVEDWASFDDAGRLCLTSRVHGNGKAAVARLVLRELESGVETSLDPGPGLLVGAKLSRDGASIDATVVTQDTDGNGVLEPPKLHGSFYEGGCAGPVSSYSVFGKSGDTPIHRILAADGSLRRDAPGFVCFVGRRWVRRLTDGSLVLEAATGEPPTIAAAALKAKVLASDDASGTVLFASPVFPEAAPVFAAGPSGIREIGVRIGIDAEFREGTRRRPARVASIGPRGGPFAFDWSKGVAIRMRGRLLACEGAHALVLRGLSLVVLDVDAGTETALPGAIAYDVYEDAWRAGPFAAEGGLVIDLVHAKIIGTYPYPVPLEYPYPTTSPAAWGLRDDGALLRSTAPSASEISLPPGPFRWEPPAAPK